MKNCNLLFTGDTSSNVYSLSNKYRKVENSDCVHRGATLVWSIYTKKCIKRNASEYMDFCMSVVGFVTMVSTTGLTVNVASIYNLTWGREGFVGHRFVEN